MVYDSSQTTCAETDTIFFIGNKLAFAKIITRHFKQTVSYIFRSQSAINAPVMSFTYYPNIVGNLEDPIEITFQVYNVRISRTSD